MTSAWNQKLNEHVIEVLNLSGSRERYSGTVTKIDGSTSFITSGERVFLAFTNSKHHDNLKIGQQVTFRVSGQRARDIKVVEV